jgi:methyl-accepting chemotaxis protein
MKLYDLKIKYKLVAITLLFLIPILLLAFFFVSEKNIAINFAQKEINGDRLIRPVRVLMQTAAALHRARLKGHPESYESILPLIKKIDEAGKELSSQGENGDFGYSEQYEAAEKKIPGSDGDYPLFHDAIRSLWSRIGDTSNLILDPDLDSYYLMDVTLLRIPEAVTLLDRLASETYALKQGAKLSEQQKIDLSVINGLLKSNIDGMGKSLAVAYTNDSTPGKTVKESLSRAVDAYTQAAGKVSALIDRGITAGSFSEAEAKEIDSAYSTAEQTQFSCFDETLSALDSLLDARISRFRKSEYITLSIVTAFSLLSIFIVCMLIGSINTSLTASAALTGKISDGDLTAAQPPKTKDELGIMLSSVGKFVSHIRPVISETRDASGRLSRSSENLSLKIGLFYDNAREQAASVEELSAGIEEISAGMESLAANSESQYMNILTLDAKLADLSDILNDMDHSIAGSREFTGNLSAQAGEGQTSLRKMTERIEIINESSGKMKGIVDIINDISEKINLLSLNASIEAARAGDSGRGFAVVAEEISTLADATAASIKEITSLISANDRYIHDGLADIKGSVNLFGTIIDGIHHIAESIDALSSKLHLQIEKNTDVSQQSGNIQQHYSEIKMAINEQKDAMSATAQSVSMINDLQQRIAMEYESLTEDARLSKKMSEDLSRNVAFFKV